MNEVVFENITKEYDNGFKAVSDLNLKIKEGEFLVMVGPSGCGKSTTLRMIAGLEDVTKGTLRIGNKIINDLAPKDRDIAMVFQNYALYPHMNVFNNMAYSLKLAKWPKSEIKNRVHDIARILELENQLDKRPGQLSGGQRQRVAMGRAIVRRPRVFLLDEPLSNLDAKLRVQMRAEITDLQREVGVTTFYVTHDQIEAMTMADRVAVIHNGVLQQVDSPLKLFNEPANTFVATFIGSPSMNLIETTIERQDSKLWIKLGSQTLAVPDSVLKNKPTLEKHISAPIAIGLRPKDFEDAALITDHPADQRLRIKIDKTEAIGYEVIAHFEIDAKPIIMHDALQIAEEDRQEQHSTRINARFHPETKVRPKDTIEVAVSMENAHFFDLTTGLAIRN
ncbi:MAG: sn-glycerol-3-phosphate ABC transporter ATP-binding protein UgpC [Acidimicrobiia bacterium]|nr:sn-glycerol-3-phosphate ABC transporter ATP-binding protein UgpC [Acidimicrobiia bacterium]MYC57461.1 sn-glycerol-3-phosphate ABC transporter ATP-binding protein UgpC [Acidimicrobiia bacterium]MYG93982.1 sn-glycerol-3-phosphate ABC transporter ATP-binding protein UgpC [Acidimicrobiia bacterium]MYI30051.1 sn-glycerol-3-phosphate ABC transporter ATP-binding protein UgpC [Acidimicrobiia bacterium]